MIQAPLPDHEESRLRKLHELGILDTLEEQAYDDLTRLAAEICGTPISLVSLVDRHRQWFKSHHGLDARETPREFAFCAHAILGTEVFVVEDSSKDERFFDNPLATDKPHVVFYAGAPLIMSDNHRLGTLCVIGDSPGTITAAQRESLQALARQVVSQLELRLKLKELEVLDHSKDEFISMVSHELRTPLTAIFGSLSLLVNDKAGDLGALPRNLVEISHRNAERLIRLVNDILDSAKLESGTFDLELHDVDLVELLPKALALNEPYCQRLNARVTLDCGGHARVLVNADEQRLLQVMSNLISNAAKFGLDGDVIQMELAVVHGLAEVRVTDHGAGIPYDKQHLLFKKFKQLSTQEHNKAPGTGLGLNICKSMIELQHGTIDCESIPHEKTTFFFRLPIVTTG